MYNEKDIAEYKILIASGLYRCQFLHIVIARSERGQTNFLRKLSKIGVSKKRDMANKFMTYIRFWCIKRSTRMSNVLKWKNKASLYI